MLCSSLQATGNTTHTHTHTHKHTHTHPTSASYGHFSRNPFVPNSPLKVARFKYPVVDNEATRADVVSLWPYLAMLGVFTTPCDACRLQDLMLHKQEIWKPLGNILENSMVIICCRNLCPNTSPKFLCDRRLSTNSVSKLLNSALFHLSPQHIPSVSFVITYQQATINQLFFPSRVVAGSVNINS